MDGTFDDIPCPGLRAWFRLVLRGVWINKSKGVDTTKVLGEIPQD